MKNIRYGVNMGFMYSFNVGDEIPYFNNMSDQEQSAIERNIVEVINDSFVKTGDEDYLTARFLALKGLERAFFWSASQAIEKYLKAFLLMRGESIKANSRGHQLVSLLNKAKKLDKRLDNVSFDFHPSLIVSSVAREHLKKLSLHVFIEDMESHGSPNNRYNEKGVDFNSAHLLGLDSFLFTLRSIIGVPDIFKSFKKIDADLMYAFKVNNPLFNDQNNVVLLDIPSPEFPIRISMNVTYLDYLRQNKPSGIELKWLDLKMKI
jgi:HEPN domain-containing protein